MKKQSLDTKTKFAIFKTLEELIIKHENGTVSYPEGFSDAEIAKLVSTKERSVSVNSVAYARIELYGKLYRKPQKKNESLVERVTKLEQIIEKHLGRQLQLL